MQLEFLPGLCMFADSIVSNAQTIIGLAQLRIRINGPGIESDCLFIIASGSIEHSKLQIGIAAPGVEGYGLRKYGFHLLQTIRLNGLAMLLPDGHPIEIIGEWIRWLEFDKT